MTREEALYKVKGYLTDIIPAEGYSEVEEIIKALEQEPKTDRENIHREREQAYMQGYEDACKKYRQEPQESEEV